MKLESPIPLAGRARAVNRTAWLAAGAVFTAIIVVYWRTAAEMVAIWARSETFTHGFVVLPISLWLVWRERDALRELPARPWFPALVACVGAGLLWLLAELASVAAAAQFALVLMTQAAVATVLGPRLTRAILFPLAFLLFAVPFGEFLVPRLIDQTADFTVLAVQATGIPVYREGNDFVIPSGSWSVVEACSGIRYLIASLMAGSLYAWLMYRTTWKRVAFTGVSIAVPIVANWLRAYMIVMIGHLSGNRLAVGVDHLIYGWFFFGLVIALMFWIGSFWREDIPAATAARAEPQRWTVQELVPPAPRRFAAAAVAAIVAAGLWLPVAHWLDAAANPAEPGALAIAPANGWEPADDKALTWRPKFQGPRAEYHALFAKDGRAVGVYIAYYSHQSQGRELVNSENQLVRSTEHAWKQLAAGTGALEWDSERLEVRRAELAARGERLAVAQLYWVGGRYTASDYVAKVLLALQKLALNDDDSAAVIIYAKQDESGKLGQATLERFARDMSRSVDRALERAAKRGE